MPARTRRQRRSRLASRRRPRPQGVSPGAADRTDGSGGKGLRSLPARTPEGEPLPAAEGGTGRIRAQVRQVHARTRHQSRSLAPRAEASRSGSTRIRAPKAPRIPKAPRSRRRRRTAGAASRRWSQGRSARPPVRRHGAPGGANPRVCSRREPAVESMGASDPDRPREAAQRCRRPERRRCQTGGPEHGGRRSARRRAQPPQTQARGSRRKRLAALAAVLLAVIVVAVVVLLDSGPRPATPPARACPRGRPRPKSHGVR